MCYCTTSEREREKQSSSLFFISFYCKVIVIFACVPQKSQMSFCANELRAFFFLAQKSTNTLNNATRQTLSFLCDDGPNFLSLCRLFESSHVFVETHLERERERAEETL